MSNARWTLWLGLIGVSACGGIPIVSGEPAVVPSDAPADATTDRSMDARIDDDRSAADASDASDASEVTEFDQVTAEPIDAPRLDVVRPETSILDAPSTVDVTAEADVGVAPDGVISACATCMRGSGSPLTCCDAACRDLRTDPTNCGVCGVGCGTSQTCVAGLCTASPDAGFPDAGFPDAGFPDAGFPDAGFPDAGFPDAGFPDAGACSGTAISCAGICTDPSVDRANCGGCGRVCAAGAFCFVGNCLGGSFDASVVCAADQVACSGGCTNTNFDRFNCGACGIACPGVFGCILGRCAGADGGVE